MLAKSNKVARIGYENSQNARIWFQIPLQILLLAYARQLAS